MPFLRPHKMPLAVSGRTQTPAQRRVSCPPVTPGRSPENDEGVDGMYVELMINENGSGILGETRCVPGDYAQINREWQESN